MKIMPKRDDDIIVVVDNPDVKEIYDWFVERNQVEGEDWAILNVRGCRLSIHSPMDSSSKIQWISYQVRDKDIAMLFKLTYG